MKEDRVPVVVYVSRETAAKLDQLAKLQNVLLSPDKPRVSRSSLMRDAISKEVEGVDGGKIAESMAGLLFGVSRPRRFSSQQSAR